MNKIIIKDVSILTPQGFKKAHMIIEGEKIKEISATDDCRDAEIISGANRRLVPGFIDIHTHILCIFNRCSFHRSIRITFTREITDSLQQVND